MARLLHFVVKLSDSTTCYHPHQRVKLPPAICSQLRRSKFSTSSYAFDIFVHAI